ncbi:MAG: HDOD domain-containing protein [Gammaproteobacteria bacterium]
MRVTPEQLINDTASLVSLPDIYLRVKAVVDDPDSSMAELATVVQHDPGISARVLKLANSAFFGFTSKIDTIGRAVNLLGGRQVHDLVLATTVAEAFSRLEPKAFDLRGFWVDSIHAGLLAREVGRACGLMDVERFFVAGLLFDIGHLILDQGLPEASARALSRAYDPQVPVDQVERQVIGCDYAEVGAALMERWQFPRAFVAGVRWQNTPAAAPEFQLDVAVVHAAVRLLRLEQEDIAAEDTLTLIDPSAVEATGLAALHLAQVCQAAGTALGETLELLFPEMRLCA